MRKALGFVLASLFGLSGGSLAGCLPAFDPGVGPRASSGGTGSDGGGGGSGSTTSGGDLGAPNGDLGTSGVGDLGGVGGGGDLAVACDPLQPTAGLSSPNGHHNAGQDCQGCHGPGGGAPTFTIGGTIYGAATGAAAVAGATINVTDANGKTVKIVSATNGNFWTSTSLVYPVSVDASLCPSTVPMTATVPSNGACNNCHNSTLRVHVP